MKSIDKLRKTLKDCTKEAGVEPNKFDTYWITANACDMLIDDVEAEINERFMVIPLDADGVPIRVGDTVTDCEEGGTYTVSNMNLYGWGWRITGNGVDKERAECSLSTVASCLRHVKPRTLEDVLHDFWEDWETQPIDIEWEERIDLLRKSESKYADEIRELMRGDA